MFSLWALFPRLPDLSTGECWVGRAKVSFVLVRASCMLPLVLRVVFIFLLFLKDTYVGTDVTRFQVVGSPRQAACDDHGGGGGGGRGKV